MSGEYLFVSAPPQDYICQICMKVLQEPHVTECCGQHFCRACLEKWFEKKQRKRVCPHCREADFAHMTYKPLQRKINELKVHCPKRCGVTLKLEDLKSHLSVANPSGCSLVSAPCPNGCGQSVFREKMDKHVDEECMKKEEACLCCNIRMTRDLLADHYENCEEMEVFCPRNCGRQLRRGDLKTHEGECPNVPVKCPFFDAGCRVQLTRRGLAEHVENGTTAHLMKFMAGYSTLRADNERLKADVESLKADNRASKACINSSLSASEMFKKEFTDFKSQVAVEVTRIKDTMTVEKPKITKSLECIESLLRGYHLNSNTDSIMFSIPPNVNIWKSPAFTVSPGYSMCIRVKSERTTTTVELLLLSGNMDEQLKWPTEIKKDIGILLYEQIRQKELPNTNPSSVKERVSSMFHVTNLALVQEFMSHSMTINPDILPLHYYKSREEALMGSHCFNRRPEYARIRLEETFLRAAELSPDSLQCRWEQPAPTPYTPPKAVPVQKKATKFMFSP